jgi:F-type H+-transporting ATPase subunit c
MGGGAGVARVGAAAVESMARQPEVAGQISTAMIITAAMIEGATLFAVVVALLAVLG